SRIGEFVRRGRAVSLATVIRARSWTGVSVVGAKLLVAGDGSEVEGSMHPDVDELVVANAREMLAQERSAVVEYETSAGTLEVFIESFPPPAQLVIVGAVHNAVPLSKFAKMLG